MMTSAQQSDAPLPLRGCHILVVEDEYFISVELDRVLSEAGATVIGPVADVERAMRLVEADGFEIALLDIKLSGGLVYEIADALSLQSIPFLFATGYDQEALPGRFHGVRRWQKPVSDEDALVRELADLLRSSRARKHASPPRV